MLIDREKSWKAIEHMSDEMFSMAKREEWEDLAKLEKMRNRLIRHFFLQLPVETETEQLTRGINNILDTDSKIIKICKFRRQSVGSKLSQFNTSRRAKNAYLSGDY